MVSLNLNDFSFLYSDTLEILISITQIDNQLDKLSNININIYRVDEKRNEFCYGFGVKPIFENNCIKVTKKLSKDMKDGIHFIKHISLHFGDPDNKDYHKLDLFAKRDFSLLFFQVTDTKQNKYSDKNQIKNHIDKLQLKRKNYREKVITTSKIVDNPSDKNYFRVYIFGVGCLLHNAQELSGYTIYPLKNGLNYSNMTNPVNEFLQSKRGFTLQYNKKIDDSFKKSTPLFVMEFEKVEALNTQDAFTHCYNMSYNVFSILGFKKGQRPRMFAYVIENYLTTNVSYNFQFPGYTGNLISDFSPSATANEIDKLFPLLDSNPWISFLIENFAFAINETKKDLKQFRLWALLELIAKKEVTDDTLQLVDLNNDNIIDTSGRDRKSKYAIDKVYYLVFNSSIPNANCSSSIPGQEYNVTFEVNNADSKTSLIKINLWDSLNAMYAIRNATAHQGQFVIDKAKQGSKRDKLAAKYYKQNIFLYELERIVKSIIDLQIGKSL